MTSKLTSNEIVKEIHKRLDYSLDYKKRIEVINRINEEFGCELQEYYFYYKASNLKEYNNRNSYDRICSVYDRMSEYILFANIDIDTKNKINDDRCEYPYTQESNLKTITSNKEISLESYVSALSRDEKTIKKHYDDQNHAVYKLKDFKKHIKDCPYVKDYLEYNKYARRIIWDYESVMKLLRKRGVKTKNIKEFNYINEECKVLRFTHKHLQLLKRGIGYTKNNSIEIDKDIVAVIRDYFGIFYFKNPLRETERYRKIDLDLMDREHVSGLIKAGCLTGHLDRFDKYVNKLKRIAKKADLTEFEKQIFDTFLKGKGLKLEYSKFEKNMMTVMECSRILNVNQSIVDKSFTSLVDKICDTYEGIYEDWYYTYKVRGKYKTCSKCGEIKIANERYFSPKIDGKGGLQAFCKKCNAERMRN